MGLSEESARSRGRPDLFTAQRQIYQSLEGRETVDDIELVPMEDAAQALEIHPSAIERWAREGFLLTITGPVRQLKRQTAETEGKPETWRMGHYVFLDQVGLTASTYSISTPSEREQRLDQIRQQVASQREQMPSNVWDTVRAMTDVFEEQLRSQLDLKGAKEKTASNYRSKVDAFFIWLGLQKYASAEPFDPKTVTTADIQSYLLSLGNKPSTSSRRTALKAFFGEELMPPSPSVALDPQNRKPTVTRLSSAEEIAKTRVLFEGEHKWLGCQEAIFRHEIPLLEI